MAAATRKDFSAHDMGRPRASSTLHDMDSRAQTSDQISSNTVKPHPVPPVAVKFVEIVVLEFPPPTMMQTQYVVRCGMNSTSETVVQCRF